MYILDTNTVSKLFKNDMIVLENMKGCHADDVFISNITEAEILYGIAKKPNNKRLNRKASIFLAEINVFEWTRKTASCFATFKTMIEQQGLSLHPMDLMIATHAFEHNKILVTNDSAFHKIPQLEVVDWSK